MKRLILLTAGGAILLVCLWFIFSHTRIGVGFRVLFQMLSPPIGIFEDRVELPVEGNSIYFEIIMKNHFVGLYAIQLKVPMEVKEKEASPFAPPEISSVKYSWSSGSYEQTPCRVSWISLGEGSRIFSYNSVLSPIEVPKNEPIRIQIQFPETARLFFAEHPGCFLSFGKASDE